MPRRARRLPADQPRRPRRGGRSPGASGRPPGRDDAGQSARLGPPEVQDWPDGIWVVRQVPGAAAAKTYRCPGCDQEIRPGTPHVVVWPEQTPGLSERRHWHGGCWQRRPRRSGPGPATHR
ncbi:MAG TPA: ATP/GTP-binding protein [Streptosporangiaceae bacterium]